MEKKIEFWNENISFGYTESREMTTKYDLHCHNFYEIYFFVEGDVDYLVEGTYYKPEPGSLLLFAPNAFHGVKINSRAPYKRYTLHFDQNLLLPERRSFLMRALPEGNKESWGTIYYRKEDTEKYAGMRRNGRGEAGAEDSALRRGGSVTDSADAGGGERNGGAGAERYDHRDSVLSEFPSAGAGDAR